MRRRSLGLMIAAALLLKFTLLYLLWHAFFAHPAAKHMHLPTATVEQHLLTPPPPNKVPQ